MKFYAVRERRRLWSSRPSIWLMLSSVLEVSIFGTLAISVILMTALPVTVVAGVLAAAAVFAFALDGVKVALFKQLNMTEHN